MRPVTASICTGHSSTDLRFANSNLYPDIGATLATIPETYEIRLP